MVCIDFCTWMSYSLLIKINKAHCCLDQNLFHRSTVDVKGNGFLERKKVSKEAANPSFADLPLCLLEVIISQLDLKDNIRASAACKYGAKPVYMSG